MASAPFFATCARGLEPVLADELRKLSAHDIAPGRGGVSFAGDRALLYRANLELRTAVRVLQPLCREVEVYSTDELYEAVRTIDWSTLMTVEMTLAVDANVRDSHITHSQYAARRVKDAICDQFRDRTGLRPSVDTERPMVGLNLHIARDRMTLSLDSSGDSLHKRGYRPALTRAPLNEALAAGLLLLSCWDPTTPLADPMCGSGTFGVEGACIALDRAPGLTRKHFGFMGWLDFDAGLWSHLREEARRRVAKTLPAPIHGSDLRTDAVGHATANARAAGIGHLLKFERLEAREFRPDLDRPGTIIINPPYGERLGEDEELFPLYRALGDLMRTHWLRERVCIFSGNRDLARAIGVRPTHSVEMYNGRIPCQFLQFTPAP